MLHECVLRNEDFFRKETNFSLKVPFPIRVMLLGISKGRKASRNVPNGIFIPFQLVLIAGV